MLSISCWAFGQAVPDPYYPKQGQIFQTTTLTFSWNGVADATSYTLQYANNASFATPVTVNGLTAPTYNTSALLAGTYYWWRVRAVTPTGTSAWSATNTFGIFFPNNFSGLSFWVSADGSVVKDANNYVSQWTDMSGSFNNVSQPNSTEQPLWQANILNGYPVIKFDGTNDYLNGGDILDIGTGNRSIFFIGRSNTNTGTYLAKAKYTNAIMRFGFFMQTGTFYAPIWHDNIEINNSYSKPFGRTELISFAAKRDTAAPFYNTKVFNIDSSGISFTRFNIQGSSYNMNPTYRFLLGSYNNANDNGQVLPLNGFLAEMLIYDAAFPDSVRRLVEKMVMDKYAPPVDLGADIVITTHFCDTVIKAGKNFVKYTWSTGQSSAVDSNLVVSAPGVYKVTATDLFGRRTVDSIVLVKPDPNFYGTPQYCLGSSVTWNTGLDKSLYSFSWSPGGSTDSFLVISAPGTYRVTVTDLRGCSRVSLPVVFSPDSFAVKINLTTATDTILCTGNTLGLRSGANLVQSYLWSTNATTPTISVDTSGLYRVTVTNSLGCVGKDSVIVDIAGDGPVPDFSVNSVCFGSAAQFNDLSTVLPPSTVTGWQWNFGDNTTSTTQNPQHTYADTGTYQVTFTALSDIGCASSPITKTVRVYPLPTANFIDSLGCVNTPMSFKSLSTVPTGSSIASWLWTFQPGVTSNLQNPSYQFTAAGMYPVSLTVTTNFGCSHTYTRQVTVVSSAPVPGNVTTITPANAANVTGATVQFVWRPTANTYLYRIEVSTTSSFSNIIYTATTTDTTIVATQAQVPPSLNQYYWRVKAVNVCNQGGTSTAKTFYRISPKDLPKLVFWVSGDGPLLKSSSQFVSDWFDQSGSNNNVYQLNGIKQPRWVDSLAKINYMPAIRFNGSQVLEGGDILNVKNSSRTIVVVGQMDANSVSGAYVAKSLYTNAKKRYAINRITGDTYFIYHDDIEYSIRVNLPYGNFETLIAKVDRSLRQLSFQQNYGNTFTSLGIQGPSYDLTSTYRFLVGSNNSANDFSEVIGLNGYIAEVLIFDTVLSSSEIAALKVYLDKKYTRPVDLGPDINIPYGYCSRITLDASERYISYRWSTGDTTSKLPVTVAGTYSVTVTDVFGNVSSDTVVVNIPSLLPPPRLTFCDRDSIIWNVNQGPAYHYLWSTGDTTPSLTIRQGGPVTITITDTIPSAQGGPCSISATYTFVADSFSVITTLGPDTTLCGGALIGLRSNNAQSVVAYNWSTGSTDTAIVVNASGNYYVNVLNATGCQASDTIAVTVAGRLATVAFTSPNAFCFGDTSTFTNQSTILPPFNILGYEWSFDTNGDTSHAQNPSYYYGAPGTYTVTLEVTSDSNCVASTSKTIRVFQKPTAKFSYQIGCAGSALNFSDQSVGVTNDALADWFWEFGDDSTSTLRNPGHVYAQPGIYEVRLTVGSATGCTATYIDTLEVFPAMNVDIKAEHLCFGETTQFFDASDGHSNISWEWEFGDGNPSSTQKNPIHNYTQTGSFLVRLTVKNALGCQATVVDTISIVQPPVADFTYNVACQDRNFRLTSTSTQAGNDSIVKWRWTFNDGGPVSNAPNPVRTYDTIGTFLVTLYIESANGCPAAVTKPVTIAPAPEASFTFTPDYGAAPLPVTYTNTSVGAIAYQWYFGDGGYSQDTNPVHTFQYNSEFTTTLIAIGPGGCRDTFSRDLTVNIATLDIAVVDIDVLNVNGRVRPIATVINQGTRNVDHYYLTSSLGDGSRVTERVDTFLASGTGMVHTFVAGYEATEFQASSFLCVVASMPNEEVDDNPLNDRLCIPLENDIRIVPPHPNPTSDFVTFEVIIPREEQLEIRMFDVVGHKLMDIYDGMAAEGTQTYKLDMNGYPQGVYIIRIKFKDDEYIYKFVTQ